MCTRSKVTKHFCGAVTAECRRGAYVGGSEVRYSHLSRRPRCELVFKHFYTRRITKWSLFLLNSWSALTPQGWRSFASQQIFPNPDTIPVTAKTTAKLYSLVAAVSVNSSWGAAACALQQNALRSFGVTPNSWYWSLPRVKRSLAVNPLRGHDYEADLDGAFTKCKSEWIMLRGHWAQNQRAALFHGSIVLFIRFADRWSAVGGEKKMANLIGMSQEGKVSTSSALLVQDKNYKTCHLWIFCVNIQSIHL